MQMIEEIKLSGKQPEGPHTALLIQGDDELGALPDIHMKLYEAKVNISAANGITDKVSEFSYIIYYRTNEFEKTVRALGI